MARIFILVFAVLLTLPGAAMAEGLATVLLKMEQGYTGTIKVEIRQTDEGMTVYGKGASQVIPNGYNRTIRFNYIAKGTVREDGYCSIKVNGRCKPAVTVVGRMEGYLLEHGGGTYFMNPSREAATFSGIWSVELKEGKPLNTLFAKAPDSIAAPKAEQSTYTAPKALSGQGMATPSPDWEQVDKGKPEEKTPQANTAQSPQETVAQHAAAKAPVATPAKEPEHRVDPATCEKILAICDAYADGQMTEEAYMGIMQTFSADIQDDVTKKKMEALKQAYDSEILTAHEYTHKVRGLLTM